MIHTYLSNTLPTTTIQLPTIFFKFEVVFFQFYLNMLNKGISNGQRKIVELQCIAFVESEHTIDCFGNKVQAIFIAMSVQNTLIF